MSAEPIEIARAAAETADAKKATDVVCLDLSGLTDVADYFVVCTAANRPLRDLVVEQVEEQVRARFGVSPLQVEGRAGDGWYLLDYGPVVVHVFLPEAREHYRLERLWSDAERVALGLGEGGGEDA